MNFFRFKDGVPSANQAAMMKQSTKSVDANNNRKNELPMVASVQPKIKGKFVKFGGNSYGEEAK